MKNYPCDKCKKCNRGKECEEWNKWFFAKWNEVCKPFKDLKKERKKYDA